jgi:hypothetical protein
MAPDGGFELVSVEGLATDKVSLIGQVWHGS